jgi:L-fuconolactonase
MIMAGQGDIDAHQHFWSLSRGDYFWMSPALAPIYRDFAPADLEPTLERSGVVGTILVQAAASVEETEYLLGIADATAWVKGVVGWVDFERPDNRRHLERFARHPKFRGVRPMIQDIPDEEWMLRPDIDWACRAIVDLGLRFDALGYPRHLENFLRLLHRHPDMNVVIDQCMKPRSAIARR